MKKGLVFLLLTVLIVSAATMAYAEQPIKIMVNGSDIISDPQPQVIGGRTFVPLRVIADVFGADVSFDSKSRTAIINTKKTTAYSLLTVNGVKTTWPYWLERDEIYMEYRNVRELVAMSGNYNPNNLCVFLDNSRLAYQGRIIEFKTKTQGPFTVLPLSTLKTEKVIDYTWDSSKETLTLKAVR
ncbi:MAG: copper amine oxidase N-terminal domain-containing protein [Acidobacteriota bacterium]